MNEWTDISCPDGCDSSLLFGALVEDQNCVAIPNLSQVCDLYIIPDGAVDAFSYPSGDDADPSLIPSGIDNTDTTNGFTKWLVGIGGVDEPDLTPYNGPKNTITIMKRVYTLSFQIDVTNKAQRDFARQLQCNPKNFKFRFGTLGRMLFGGASGITPLSSDAILSLGNGNEDFELCRIVLRWEVKGGYGDPPRHVNPHAST